VFKYSILHRPWALWAPAVWCVFTPQKNHHSYTESLHEKWTNRRFMHEKVGVKQHWLTPHSRKWHLTALTSCFRNLLYAQIRNRYRLRRCCLRMRIDTSSLRTTTTGTFVFCWVVYHSQLTKWVGSTDSKASVPKADVNSYKNESKSVFIARPSAFSHEWQTRYCCCISVRLSVCDCVTFRYCVKTF